MKRLIIGAPFGNYLSHPEATSTLGTYTVKNRAGFMRWWLLWRVALTLRRYGRIGAWVNKLGLPNPGLQHLCGLILSGAVKPELAAVSVHGFDGGEWLVLLDTMVALAPATIELNVSCPNVGELSVPKDLFTNALKAADKKSSVVVKLPPVNYWETYKLALASGVRAFHCCNTLPTPVGGLSGKPLKRICLDVISRIKDHDPDVMIIGGGGITGPDDIDDYYKAGAEYFSVASAFLSPRLGLPWNRRAFIDSLNKRITELRGTA